MAGNEVLKTVTMSVFVRDEERERVCVIWREKNK